MNQYKELDEVGYTEIRTEYINKVQKGSEKQKMFLRMAGDDARFIEFMDKCGSTDGEEVSLYSSTFTSSEFQDPPNDTEKELYEKWKHLTPRIACRTSFWGMVTLSHIKAGKLHSSDLATTKSEAGKTRIDKVLSENTPENIDKCVRTIFRTMSGLPEARGNRSVYTNCPLARAWWKQRITENVLNACSLDEKKINQVLRVSQSYWEALVTLIVSKNSVIGTQAVHNALIAGLAEWFDKNPETPLKTGKNLRALCKNLSAISASRELGILEFDELLGLIRELIQRYDEKVTNEPPKNHTVGTIYE